MKKNNFLRDLTPPAMAMPAKSIPAPYPPRDARLLCRDGLAATSTGVQLNMEGFVQ